MHPVAARVEQPPAQSGVQLALHPLAAQAVLGCRSAELVGPGDHGHEVLGRVAAELHDRVCSQPDAEGRLDVVQRWVRARLDAARPSGTRPELGRAWHLAQAVASGCRTSPTTCR